MKPVRSCIASFFVSILFCTACSLDVQILSSMGKNSPSLKSFEVKEITQECVVIEMTGKCPEDASDFKVLVDGNVTAPVAPLKFSMKSLGPGEVSAQCSTDQVLTIRYGVPDPNAERKIVFSVAAQYDNGFSKFTEYPVEYKRPLVPNPVILTNNGDSFSTNALIPALQGACISERVSYIEYKVGNGSWTFGANCTDDLWLLNLPGLSGNPAQTHVVDIRSVNPTSIVRHSEETSIQIEIDRVPPTTGPQILGVLGDQDVVADAWLGGLLPKIEWTVDSDLKEIRLTIVSDDEAIVYCPLLNVDNTGSYQLTSENCIASFNNAETYRIKAWGKDHAGNLSSTPQNFTFTVDHTSPIVSFTSTPAEETRENFVDVFFTSSPGGGSQLSSQTCILDGTPVMPCLSPLHFSNLSLGPHTLSITVRDAAGNTEILSHNWTNYLDNSPDAISFTNQIDVDPDLIVTSNTITLNGFEDVLTATCSNCSAISRNGIWGGTSVSGFMPGDTIAVRVNSATSFATPVTTTVTVGATTSVPWSVQTRTGNSCLTAPWGFITHGTSVDAFSFADPSPPATCASNRQTRTCNDGTLSGTFAFASCSEGCIGTPWGSVSSGYSATAYSSATPTGACVSETRTCTNGNLSGSYTATSCSPGCSLPWGGSITTGQTVTGYQSANPIGACVSEDRTCTAGTLSGSYTAGSCNAGCTGTPWGNVTHGYSNTAYAVNLSPNCAGNSQVRTCSNGVMSGSYTITSCSPACAPQTVSWTNGQTCTGNVPLTASGQSNTVDVSICTNGDRYATFTCSGTTWIFRSDLPFPCDSTGMCD